MNTKQLTYVLTLAQCGSFSKAAEELNISQPSLSQYIKKIEEETGTVLFERAGGYVRLTDSGRVYADTGRQILELEKEMHSRFSDISDNKGGTLVIGISAHRSVCLMPSIVARFKESYTGICVVLKEYPRDELIERSEHGEFDLCITTPPVSKKAFDVLASFEEEILLAVPQESDMCRRFISAAPDGPADLTLLNNSDFVMLNKEHPMQKEFRDICDTYGLTLNKTVECTSLEALISMVNEGMGAALVPACLKKLATEKTRFFRIAQEIPKRDIVLIRKQCQYVPDKISDMSKIITDMLGEFFS